MASLRLQDKEIFENLHDVLVNIPFKPEHQKLAPNHVLRRVKQVHDKFSPSSKHSAGFEMGDMSSSFTYSPEDQFRWKRELDDRPISVSSLFEIPLYDSNVYPTYQEIAKNDKAYQRWLDREVLLDLVDEWEAENIYPRAGDVPHPQLIGAGPPPEPSAFVSDDAYLRHVKLWAHGKHPYVRRARPDTSKSQKGSTMSMDHPFYYFVKDIYDVTDPEAHKLHKLSIWFNLRESQNKFHPHFPELVNAPPPKLPRINKPEDRQLFFKN